MLQPPRSSRLKACGASGPPSTRCATSAAHVGSPDFMSKVPSPIVTIPGVTTPAIAGPTTVAAAPNPSTVPTLPSAARVPERPSEELMPYSFKVDQEDSLKGPVYRSGTIPPLDPSNTAFGIFLDNIPLSQHICQANPIAPPHKIDSAIADSNIRNTGATDDHVSDDVDDSTSDDDGDGDDGDDNDNGDEVLQLIETVAPTHIPADSSSRSTVCGHLTLQDLHARQDILEHHINRIKGAITKLQKELSEACRFNQEQNNRLHKIDIHMEHIVDNYFDIVNV
ncbi:hypothetical protein V8E53_004510 [Lactarius tabidus]